MKLKQVLALVLGLVMIVSLLPTVLAVPPVAQSDSANAVSGQNIVIDVLANDSDPDNNPVSNVGITVTGVQNPSDRSGSVTISNNNVIYRSAAGFTGTDTFTYTITDSNNETATSTVTVTVVAAQSAALSVTPIPVLFDNANRGSQLTLPVTIRNTGNTNTINGVTATLANVNSNYQATIAGTVPSSLAPGTSATFNVQLTIPVNEDSGNKAIGNLLVAGSDGSTSLDKTIELRINPKSYLEISDFKVNGKSSGDLSIEEDNEIEVKVRNLFTEDIEDVDITVEILDVDGDDLQEDESVDINNGDREEVTLTFDLAGEILDEDNYDIKVTVDGTDDNGATHTVIKTYTVDVDRDNHKILIKKASLDRTSVSCAAKNVNLLVRIENVGKSDEDDVEIKVVNSELDLDIQKENIDLDDFKGSDNDYQTTFPIDLTDAKSGEYDLQVEVYRDGNLDDSENVPLAVVCSSASNSVAAASGNDNNDLVNELQRGLETRRVTDPQASIRNTGSYLVLLGILAILAFVAVVLALAVLLTRKKK